MKITVPVPTEIDITHLRIEAPVNYDDEEMPLEFPGRTRNLWAAAINLETRKIENWPQGRTESVYLTVKDEGAYFLFDAQGNLVAKREREYVPHGVVPGEYGDVIKLAIAPDGTVTNWPSKPDLSAFFKSED